MDARHATSSSGESAGTPLTVSLGVIFEVFRVAAAAAGGLSLHQIGQLLGHRNPRTTARYADLVDDAAARAAEQVGQALAKVMNGGDEEV